MENTHFRPHCWHGEDRARRPLLFLPTSRKTDPNPKGTEIREVSLAYTLPWDTRFIRREKKITLKPGYNSPPHSAVPLLCVGLVLFFARPPLTPLARSDPQTRLSARSALRFLTVLQGRDREFVGGKAKEEEVKAEEEGTGQKGRSKRAPRKDPFLMRPALLISTSFPARSGVECAYNFTLL